MGPQRARFLILPLQSIGKTRVFGPVDVDFGRDFVVKEIVGDGLSRQQPRCIREEEVTRPSASINRAIRRPRRQSSHNIAPPHVDFLAGDRALSERGELYSRN